jgi:uncharacterized integral membrane protein
MNAGRWIREIGSVVWLLSLILRQNQRRTPEAASEDTVRFPLGTIILWSRLIGTLAMIWLAIHQLRYDRGLMTGPEPVFHLLVAALRLTVAVGIVWIAITMLLELPGTITVNSAEIQQSFWLRRKRKIRWEDISTIAADKGLNEIEIEGSDRSKIIHSRLHTDGPRFISEVKRHCGSEFPVGFPEISAEPSPK